MTVNKTVMGKHSRQKQLARFYIVIHY